LWREHPGRDKKGGGGARTGDQNELGDLQKRACSHSLGGRNLVWGGVSDKGERVWSIERGEIGKVKRGALKGKSQKKMKEKEERSGTRGGRVRRNKKETSSGTELGRV